MLAYDLTALYSPKGELSDCEGCERRLALAEPAGSDRHGQNPNDGERDAQKGRPALVHARYKTLVAQLCNELHEFFPENSLEDFISYYDCYQTEDYDPVKD